jgi:mevalonate kinase
VRILAPDVGLDSILDQLPNENPIGAAIQGVTAALGVQHIPACTVKVTSTIPVASGLGSGAAVSAAVIRALAGFLGRTLSNEQVSKLTFNVEKIHHGTPSGIDNTVVTYGQPVYFVKGQPVETFHVAQPFQIIIADTGIRAPTKESVGDVRQAWQADPIKHGRLFGAIGSIGKTARQAIEGGHPERLGPLMDENHELLQAIDVSSSELDHLVKAAKGAGALGAKLSGGGRGGNMIALVESHQVDAIVQALQTAGAKNVLLTEVGI